MSEARLVITAIEVKGRSPAEGIAAYGVSRSWLYELLAWLPSRGRRRVPAAIPEMTDARTHIPWVRASGMSCDITWLAVAVGFEPTEACTSHAFEACSFGRSDTPPSKRLQAPLSAEEGA